MLKKINQILFAIFGVILLVNSQFAFAQQESTSQNYGVTEVFMGPGGSSDFSSSSYTGRSSIGDTALPQNPQGLITSTNNQAYTGNTSTSAPELEVNLPSASIDMGVFNPGAVSTGTATFSVRSYLASGYVVYTYGSPPTTTGGADINPMTAGGTSTPGTEQFGINLVANTSPSVGANASQGQFGIGYAANNYNTANNFRYNVGDVIARSDSSSGVTTYTISYIVNVHPVTTPAGRYIFRQSIVVAPTF